VIDGNPHRQTKITFGEMRASGVHGLLVYCANYKCSHSTAISADRWRDDVRLSDIEPLFVCHACGQRGADVRPDFHWEETRLSKPHAPTLIRTLHRDARDESPNRSQLD
jgi:hypothetical protein